MNESFRQIEYFYNKIPNENNIMICEYLLRRTVFCKYSKQNQYEKASYINIKKCFYNVLLKVYTYISNANLKTSISYNIFVEKKCF